MKPEAEIDMKELKVVVNGLNASGLVAEKLKVVGISKQKLAEAFVAAIDGLTDEQQIQLGTDHQAVADFYNDLIADETGAVEVEGEETVAEAEAAEVTECPTFGTGWDESSEECKSCLENFAEDYVQCKAAVEAANAGPEPEPEPEPEPVPAPAPAPRGRRGPNAPATTVEAKAAEPKKRGPRTTLAATPAAAGKPGTLTPATSKPAKLAQQHELSGLGHRKDTMAGVIDTMLLQPNGTTKKLVVAKLMRDFNRPEDKAEAKFLAHITYLVKKEGVDVKKVGEGDAVKYSVTQG